MVLSGIRPSFPSLSRSAGQITHVLLTRSPLEHPHHKNDAGLSVRLACVKHAASVRPEPGSNSPKKPVTQETPRTQGNTQAPQEPAPPRQTKQAKHTPNTPTKSMPRTHPAKNQTNKTHKNKTHYRDLKQHTQHPDYRRNESSVVAVRRSKNLAGEFATVKPGTCDPSLLGRLIRTVEFLGPHRPHGSWRQTST